MLVEKYNSIKPMERLNYVINIPSDIMETSTLTTIQSELQQAVQNIQVAKAINDIRKYDFLEGYSVTNVDIFNQTITVLDTEDNSESTIHVDTEDDAKRIKYATIYLRSHSLESVSSMSQFIADTFFNGDLDMLYFKDIFTQFKVLESHTDKTILEAWEKGQAKFSDKGQKALTKVKESIKTGINEITSDYIVSFDLQISNKFILRLYKSCLSKGIKVSWNEKNLKSLYQACAMLYLDKVGIKCLKDNNGVAEEV